MGKFERELREREAAATAQAVDFILKNYISLMFGIVSLAMLLAVYLGGVK